MNNDESEDSSDGGVQLLTPRRDQRGGTAMALSFRSQSRDEILPSLYNNISDKLCHVDLEFNPLIRISEQNDDSKARRRDWLQKYLRTLRWQIKICEDNYLDMIESRLWYESSQLWPDLEVLWSDLDMKQKELQLLGRTDTPGERASRSARSIGVLR